MIITEQNNKNNEELGATRTFSVTSNSAESLKNRINQANEQNLTRRSNAANRQAQNSTASSAHSEVHTSRPNTSQQNPNRQVNSNSVQTHSQVQPVRRPQTARPTSQQPAQKTMQNPSQKTAQGQAVRQIQPQKSAGAVQQSASPQNRQIQPEQHQPAPKADPQKNAQQKPVQREAQQQRPSAQKMRTESIASRSMMQTKQNSVAGISKSAPVKEKYEDYGGSDEGGNTVVSVLKAVIYIIFVIVISVFLAFGLITVGNDVFAFVKSDEVVELTIPEYATIDDVAEVLFQNDVIKYPDVFKLYAAIKEDDGEFLAGTYSVSPMTNYDNLLDSFKEQPVTGIVRITIPEGSTTDEIIDIFLAKGIGTREGFIDVIENYDFDYWFIDELEKNGISDDRIYRLDGYLFPDTYDFYLNSSEYTVINKLLKRFTQIFTKEYREQCAAFGYTVDEIITLASIIEKEAGAPSEFFTVSSVFHNRLNAPWSYPKLESDATIVYALSHENGERTAISAADLQYDTPYNTYLYDGFPPGPIANPSASAMLAAILPTETNYYFFVANKGKTYFSETKDQHDAYIAQFKAEAQAAGTES